jgi:hypothetical protein
MERVRVWCSIPSERTRFREAASTAPGFLLVIGMGPGDTRFFECGQVFATQLDSLQDCYTVRLGEVPEFVLPGSDAWPDRVPVSVGSAGWDRNRVSSTSSPDWIRNGTFTAQMFGWKQALPELPDSSSRGLAVHVDACGQVYAGPFGRGSGIELSAETDVDSRGRSVLRFPFSIADV